MQYINIFEGKSALLIESNLVSRTLQSNLLKNLGFSIISTASTISSARKLLAERVYDAVLCDYYFNGDSLSGQDLLEEIRQTRLAPFSTLFVMVTGEASYEKVAEVAEIAPDDYILKPFTPAQMEERLEKAILRKQALLPIFELIELSKLTEACDLALSRSRSESPYRLNYLRIAAELLIKLDRVEEAKAIYDAVGNTRALPWSRLGMAIIDIRMGNATKASRTLELLISEYPQYIDAYDALGKLHLSQGEGEKALAVFKEAILISPNNIPRLQRYGLLSFIHEEYDEAERCFDKAIRIGFLSKDFDYRTIVLSMFVKMIKGATREASRLLSQMDAVAQKFPESYRIATMLELCKAAALISRDRRDLAKAICFELLQNVVDPKFDFELACDVQFLLSTLTGSIIEPYPAQQFTRLIANRFAVSPLARDVLVAGCRGIPYLKEIVREVFDEGVALSRKSLQRLLKQEYDEAAEELLNIAQTSLNARYIMMLFNLAKKLESIPEKQELAIKVRSTGETIKNTYCTYGSKLLNLDYSA